MKRRGRRGRPLERWRPPRSADPIVEEPSDEAEDLSKPEAAVVTVPTIVISPVTTVGEGVLEEKEEELVSSEPDAADTGGTVDTSSSSEAQAATEKPAPSGAGTPATTPSTPSQQQQPSAPQATTSQRRRIVWEEPEPASSSAPAPTPAVAQAVGGAQSAPSPAHFSPPTLHTSPAPSAGPGLISPQQQQQPHPMQQARGMPLVRGLRGRRVRLRGALPQGRGMGPGGRGMGPGGRGGAGPMWTPGWRGGRPPRGPHPF